MAKTLMAVDGSSLLHRAFYALPILTNSNGEYTNAVYGFFSMLINALGTLKPDYLAVAFDKKGKTFRHDMFESYKGTRKPTPDELIPQFDLLKESLKAVGIPTLELEGYEADDILGVLSNLAAKNGMQSVLLTGDKDAFQLISESCRVMLTRKGVSEIEVYDMQKLKDEYALVPQQIVDLKGFMGDSSDNIPGVPGVGEKTALKLLQTYKSMDGVYSNIGEISGKLKEKLEENKELAFLSRTLAEIDKNAPVEVSLPELEFKELNVDNARDVFQRLGFVSLIKRLGGREAAAEETNAPKVDKTEISDMQHLNEALSEQKSKEHVAVYFGDDISLAYSPEKEYVVKSEHSLLNTEFSRDMVIKELKPLLEDEHTPKLMHDAKQAIYMLKSYGVNAKGILFDTKLAQYALDPGSGFELDALKEKYGLGGSAAAIVSLYSAQKEQLKNDGLWYVYNDIEMPLMEVLLDMEETGFKIDLKELEAYTAKLSAEIDALTASIYELCEYDNFNINSTKQLGQVLFERLALPAGKKKKTGYSTDIEVLEKLSGKHPVIDKIIEYRRLTKLKSTYLDGLKSIADKNGFVHTTFMQISTVTGRISSKEPNLQNIPIRTQEGKEIRRLFLPSSDARKLVTADYSQIELRILASISGDSVMKSAFLSGVDIHARTASEVFGVPLERVTEEMRRSAKAVNFGIVYGISDFGLSRNLGIPVKVAAEYIRRYLARFSGVREYMEMIKEKAKADGYVTTLLGRRRYLPELKSKNYSIRSFGERAALNTPIQGTAADIIKLAMIEVSKRLKQGGYQSKLILQVHDELIIDAAPDEIEAVSSLLKDCMENTYKLDVPLTAQVSVGDNWLDAK
ncbi:MAG: DNA polymerase I [Burkholderiales bacterium]